MRRFLQLCLNQPFKIEVSTKEGMKVMVVGRISLYENSGSYQIYIEHMEPDGVGALYQALAELREKLGKEGLLKGLNNSCLVIPNESLWLQVLVVLLFGISLRQSKTVSDCTTGPFPTLVQGEQAADDIVRNIQRADAQGDFDTMIIGRGGGSIEDLWPFNEEKVARAIHAATTPIISSVGHETDVTIADMVADVRAATNGSSGTSGTSFK